MKYSAGWLQIKREINEMQICKKIMTDYIKHGSFVALEPIYDTTSETLSRFIKVRENQIKKQFPEIFNLFKNAKGGKK